MTEWMKKAAQDNAEESLKQGKEGNSDLEGFFFQQAWALCPRTTLAVRMAGKKAQG